MYGAGAGYFDTLISAGAPGIVELHGEVNPAFPGMNQPEPITANLGTLIDAMEDATADIGLATDGDADRLGVVDDNGEFVATTETFSLLCMHLLDVLGQSRTAGEVDNDEQHDRQARRATRGRGHRGRRSVSSTWVRR